MKEAKSMATISTPVSSISVFKDYVTAPLTVNNEQERGFQDTPASHLSPFLEASKDRFRSRFSPNLK
ncbi:hypothetical protein TNCV_5103221 [Trichonephila clavipes]|nr:hypothetical protein TNCV_5103221 [Trichonephila clavipes]